MVHILLGQPGNLEHAVFVVRDAGGDVRSARVEIIAILGMDDERQREVRRTPGLGTFTVTSPLIQIEWAPIAFCQFSVAG